MGQISKDTFKKLVLLYLVGKYKDGGIYTSYRFQKVLYFSTKASEYHPFTFHHTQHGQYSYNARRIQDSLVWINFLNQTGLPEYEEAGTRWTLAGNEISRKLSNLLPQIAPNIAESIDKSVDEYGYLKSSALVERAEADDLLKKTPYGSTLLEENLAEFIEVQLDDDECEDIELSLNDRFLIAMDKLVDVIEATDFDMGKVKRVDSIL